MLLQPLSVNLVYILAMDPFNNSHPSSSGHLRTISLNNPLLDSSEKKPQWETMNSEKIFGSTHYCRRLVGTSMEGHPFSWVEAIARHAALHFYTSTSPQQKATLHCLDLETQASQAQTMDI